MVDIKIHRKNEEKISKLYALIKTITILLLLSAIFFVNYILSNEFNSAQKYMEERVVQTASNIQGRFTSSINEMKVLEAKLEGYTKTYEEQEIKEFLQKNIKNNDYNKLFFIYKDGTEITAYKDKNVETTKNKELQYNEIFNTKKIYAKIEQDKNSPIGCTLKLAVPIIDLNNEVIGIIASEKYPKKYTKIIGINNYNEKGLSYIINSNGDFIINPQNDESEINNFFEMKIHYIGSSKEKILSEMENKTKGSFLINYNSDKYIASFAKISNSDRYVITIVPLHILMLHIDKLLAGVTITVLIISFLLLTLSYLSTKIFKQNENIIYKMAFTDDVTGEGNRNKFLLDARKILDSNRNSNYAIISMDITKFKAINELYGYDRANDILKDIYQMLKRNITEGSICVRDYAAKFIILYRYDDKDLIKPNFIDKILDELIIYNKNSMKQMTYKYESLKTAKLSLSFGIYLIQNPDISIDGMCERAYIAKRSIKNDVINVYKFYDDAIRNKILKDKEIEDEMYSALNNNEFKMFLQPKFDLKTKELSGAEALARWIHTEKGLIPPMDFIPLFEQNGFILELDRCIWEQACSFLSQRKKQGLKLFHISVNVSRLHMNNDSFISELVGLTQTYNIEPKYLELELTETACFNNEKRFKEIINKLKLLGFTISMDDFGTGYSSLNMLRHLPVDVLKLDRGFIKDTINDKRGQMVIECIIDLANKLKMTTVAEGIETEEQADYLRSAGCQIAQGFLYGKPMDTDSFTKTFLDKNLLENNII